jgi:hypothetical protein
MNADCDPNLGMRSRTWLSREDTRWAKQLDAGVREFFSSYFVLSWLSIQGFYSKFGFVGGLDFRPFLATV